jgi:hypothetical protein
MSNSFFDRGSGLQCDQELHQEQNAEGYDGAGRNGGRVSGNHDSSPLGPAQDMP